MEEQIYINISRVLSGEANQDEFEKFNAWLNADTRNQALYEEARSFWQYSDKALRKRQFNFEPALAAFLAQRREEKEHKQKKVIRIPAWVKYSAGMAAILIIGYFIMNVRTGTDMVSATASAENTRIELPDGSVVILRKGSALNYTKEFAAATREVELTGEAFFDVTPDKDHPFLINASGARVRVLGTSFNVQAGRDKVSVVVKTGKVQLSDKKDEEKLVVLTPGEMGVLKDRQVTEQPVNVEKYLEWTKEGLRFKDKPLSEIIRTVAKAKKVTISFSNDMPSKTKEQRVSISFQTQTVEEILNELCMVARCKWVREKGVYVIKPGNG